MRPPSSEPHREGVDVVELYPPIEPYDKGMNIPTPECARRPRPTGAPGRTRSCRARRTAPRTPTATAPRRPGSPSYASAPTTSRTAIRASGEAPSQPRPKKSGPSARQESAPALHTVLPACRGTSRPRDNHSRTTASYTGVPSIRGPGPEPDRDPGPGVSRPGAEGARGGAGGVVKTCQSSVRVHPTALFTPCPTRLFHRRRTLLSATAGRVPRPRRTLCPVRLSSVPSVRAGSGPGNWSGGRAP